MQINPNLELYVDKSGENYYYWIDVTIPTEENMEFTSHGSVPETANEEDELHIDVNLRAYVSGSTTIQVLIGEAPLDEENGEVHIHLFDQQSNPVGGGTVRVEEAQQATKPIGF